MSRGVVNLGTLEIGLPEECPVGQHEAVIVHRSGGADARLVNRCGKCGRQIERQTEAGGPGDPWMTEAQYRAEIQELEADERIGGGTAEERCPPRE